MKKIQIYGQSTSLFIYQISHEMHAEIFKNELSGFELFNDDRLLEFQFSDYWGLCEFPSVYMNDEFVECDFRPQLKEQLKSSVVRKIESQNTPILVHQTVHKGLLFEWSAPEVFATSNLQLELEVFELPDRTIESIMYPNFMDQAVDSGTPSLVSETWKMYGKKGGMYQLIGKMSN